MRAVRLWNRVSALVVRTIGKWRIDFAQHVRAALAVRPNHDPIGEEKIRDRRPLAQELGIGRNIEVLGIGAVRQRQTARELRRGGYSELPSSFILALTLGALLLALGTLVIVASGF